MPTSYRPYYPDQALLLPESLSDWLPEDHLAYFISEIVDALDLSAFHRRYDGDGRRRQPYDPAMMVKVLVYGYAVGVFSSRRMARRLQEDVAFRVLAAGNFPAHRTIREFRRRHLPELEGLFVQVVQVAGEAGLLTLGRLGIDGSKVRANASKRKSMSYRRMVNEQTRLKSEIKGLLEQAESTDAAEDARFGESVRGDELPEELSRRSQRLETIQAAKARVEARQREADRERGRHADDDRRPPSGRGPSYKRDFGVPADTAQDNFTDPQSRIMNTSSEGYQQCYNGQIAVDEGSQLIVATGLTESASDTAQLLPLVASARRNTGRDPQVVLADTGYASESNFVALEKQNIAACVSLGREGKSGRVIDTQRYPASARMARTLATPEGCAHYRRRKVIPEPVFGWIKHVLGFRRFSLRGRSNARGEWNLVCLATNLKRMQTLRCTAA